MMEALVSISIMTLVFIAPLDLAFKTSAQFEDIQKRVVANNLAQEGIDIVQSFKANAALLCIRDGDCDQDDMSYYWADNTVGFVPKILNQCGVSCAIDVGALHYRYDNAGGIDYGKFIAGANCISMYAHDDGVYTCSPVIGMGGEKRSDFSRYIKVSRYNDIGGAVTRDTELLLTSGVSYYFRGYPKNIEIQSVIKIEN